jgi:VRR-NUC domain
MVKAKKVTANTLAAHALRALDMSGFNVWRQNNGGVYDPTKKVFRRNSSTPGVADIIGYHRTTGCFCACEIKAGKDRLSAAQEMFLSSIEKAGGFVFVIRTMDDVEAIYKRFKKMK